MGRPSCDSFPRAPAASTPSREEWRTTIYSTEDDYSLVGLRPMVRPLQRMWSFIIRCDGLQLLLSDIPTASYDDVVVLEMEDDGDAVSQHDD